MSHVDGRKLGSTGEVVDGENRSPEVKNREEFGRYQVDMRETVENLECDRRDDRWYCKIDGEGSGFQNRPVVFDELDLPSRADIDISGEHLSAVMNPEGECHVDTVPYQKPQDDRHFVCE